MSNSAAPDSTTERQGSVLGRYGEQLALPVAWLAMIVFFSVMEPDLFPTTRNLGSVLGTQTALFIIALAALLPAMAGDLDLSLGWTGALGAMVMAVLNTKHDWDIVSAALVAILIGAACGFLNGRWHSNQEACQRPRARKRSWTEVVVSILVCLRSGRQAPSGRSKPMRGGADPPGSAPPGSIMPQGEK